MKKVKFLLNALVLLTLTCSVANTSGAEVPNTANAPTVGAKKSKLIAKATIIDVEGAKAFEINGKPEVPLFLAEQEISANNGPRFAKAGFKFYTSIERTHYLHLDWEPTGFNDKGMLSKVLRTFDARMPAGCYLMPKLHLWAPAWWLVKNPDQWVQYMIPPANPIQPSDPAYAPTVSNQPIHESYASVKWRNQAGEILRQEVRFILDNYPNRVKAIFLANGMFGEWVRYRAEYIPDVSQPMLVYFRGFLKKKYDNDVSALRKAWDDNSVTFETADFPDLKDLTTPVNGVFLDPNSKKVFDYYQALHQLEADLIDYFCKIVKDESNGKLLTCVNYVYEPDMPWLSQTVDQRAAAAVLRLDSVDMLSSPHSYTDRDLGGHGFMRNYPESVAAHGKMFLDEADERTHYNKRLSPRDLFNMADNIEEDIYVLNRSFGNMMAQGVGGWFMDQSSGSWYDDPTTPDYDPNNPILTNFDNIKKWADKSLKHDRSRINDIAVIHSSESEYYVGNSDANKQLDANFVIMTKRVMAIAGAPFNSYLIEDLVDGLVPEHKVYIFMDCFYLTPEQKKAINALKTNNHTLVWFFAPGYINNHGFSKTSMEQLTGFNFTVSDDPFEYVYVKTSQFPGAPEQFQGNNNCGIEILGPRFIPESKGAQVWGTYDDEGKQPAVVSKDNGTWKSVYSATAGTPPELLRKIYTDAGVHIYSTSNDVLNANNSWIMLHGQVDSNHTVTISLPKTSDVYDVVHNKPVAANVSRFNVNTKKGKTDVFLITPPKK